MTQSRASTPCPKCGKAFGCCIKLSPDERSYLADQFDRCLCPDCLKQIKTADSIRIIDLDDA